MCRHLAYLGPAGSRSASSSSSPPHGLYRQSWAPRRQRHGTVNADGFGVGWYADGRPGARPATGAPGPIWARPVLRRPGPGGPHRGAAGRRAGRHRGGRRRRGRRRAVRRRAPGCSATTARSRGWPRHAGAARRDPAARPSCCRWRPAATRRSSGRWSLHRLRAGRRAGPGAGRHGPGGRRGRPRLPAQPAAHRRRDDRRHRLGRHPLVPRPARPPHGRGLRAVRRRSALAEVPDRTLLTATRTDVLLTPLKEAAPREPLHRSTRTLPADATDAALRADVAARADPHPQDAAAEVVLRRARQRALRGDHPAARVLPDARRAGDPDRPRRRRSPRATGARTLVELGSGSSEKTRHLLDALPGPAHATCRSTSARAR